MPTKQQLEEQIANLKQELENLKAEYEVEKYDNDLFCDAFDVASANEAIEVYWKHLPECCQEELLQKGFAHKKN